MQERENAFSQSNKITNNVHTARGERSEGKPDAGGEASFMTVHHLGGKAFRRPTNHRAHFHAYLSLP